MEKENQSKISNLFIVFEGIDGCGKTTQAKKLFDFFNAENNSVFLTNEPFNSEIGQLLRKRLKEKKITNQFINNECYIDGLLFTANRMEHNEVIATHLIDKKEIVICDRYLDSTLNYQETAYYFPKDTPLFISSIRGWLLKLNHFILQPHIVFILDNEAEECIKNIQKTKKDREKFETIEFLNQLRQTYRLHKGFHELSNLTQIRGNIPEYKVIFCKSKSIETIHEEILNFLKYYLKTYKNIELFE